MRHALQEAKSPASWLAAALISLIVSSAVIVNGASGIIANYNPAVALKLNPLRSDERVAVAIERIEEDGIRPFVEIGLQYSPVDARFYSLLGILSQQDDDLDIATKMYKHALGLLPTEIQALSRQLAIDVKEGQFLAAALKLEILGRRWPRQWPALTTALPYIISDPTAYDYIVERFGTYRPLRNQLISSLSDDSRLLPYAYNLAVDWHSRKFQEMDSVVNSVTDALLNDRRFSQAYLLFQLTRPDNAQTGFVYNRNFERSFSGNAFDWRVSSQAGVSIDHNFSQDKLSYVSFRFLDNPVQFRNLAQLMRLVPGPYEIAITYTTRDLTIPKPIQLGVRCLESNRILVTANLAEGSTERKDTFALEVPPSDCPLQEIFFFNEKLPLSWRYRYSGTLMFNSVSITRKTGA